MRQNATVRPLVPLRWVAIALSLAAVVWGPSTSFAADIIKTNNTTIALNLGTAWVSGTAPTLSDIAVWTSLFNTADTNGPVIGGNIAWGGIRVDAGGTAVPLIYTSSGAKLTLGSAGYAPGIDMSAATRSFTIVSTLELGASQTFNIAAGQTLTQSGVFTTLNYDLNLTGGGRFLLTGGTTGTGGAITVGSGTTLQLGTITSGSGIGAGKDIINNGIVSFFLSDTTTTYGNRISGAGLLNVEGSYLSGSTNLTFTPSDVGNVSDWNKFTGQIVVTNASTMNLSRISGGDVINFFGDAGSYPSLELSRNATFNVSTGTTGTPRLINQSFSGTTLGVGSTTISPSANVATRAITLNLGGITRATGGSVNIPSLAFSTLTTTTAPSSGILGGYATLAGSDWIALTGSGPYTMAALTRTVADDNNWTAGVNTNVTGNFAVGPNAVANSVRFAAATAASITLSGSNEITSGGIVVAASVGANATSITGGVLKPGTSTELFVHQYNTAPFTIASVIADGPSASALTKTGIGTLVLGGINTYTGGTYLTAGTLSVSSNANLGDITTAAPLNITSVATTTLQATESFSLARPVTMTGRVVRLIVDDGKTLTVPSVISGAAYQLNKTGTGNLVLSNTANTFTGGLSFTNGILEVASLADGGVASSLGQSSAPAGNLVLDSATLRYTGVPNVTTNRLFTMGTGGMTLESTGGKVTWNSTGAFAYTGTTTRTLTLAGSGDGQLSIDMPNPTAGVLNILKTGTGVWTLASAAGSYTPTITITGGGVLAAATVPASTGSSAIGVLPTGGNASRLVIDGSTFRYTGVAINSTSLLFSVTPNGGTFEASGSGALTLSNTSALGMTDTGDRTLTLSGTNTAINTLAPVIGNPSSGTTSLTKSGVGTWLLTGLNTFTGPVNVNGGVLVANTFPDDVSAGSPLGKALPSLAANLVLNGGTLRYLPTSGTGESTARHFTLGAAGGTLDAAGSSTQPITWSSTDTVAMAGSGSRTLTLGGASTATNIFAGLLPDAGPDAVGLTKSGAGTWLISNNQTFTGPLAVNGGNLIVTGSTAHTAGTTLVAGTTLQLGNATSSGSVNGVIGGTGGTLRIDRTDNFELTNTITGSLALTKVGANVLTLTGPNSYTGITTVSSGTLKVSNLANGGVPSDIGLSTNAAANFVFGGGATLQYVGAGSATDRLWTITAGGATFDASGSGLLHFTSRVTIANTGTGARTLFLTGTGSGAIQNYIEYTVPNAAAPLSITKTGTGTWTLSGASTYSGGTTISQGVLEVTGSYPLPYSTQNYSSLSTQPAAGDASKIVIDGGTLKFNAAAFNANRTLFTVGPNGGTFEASGTGALNLSLAGTLGASGSGSRTLTLGGTAANTLINTLAASLPDPSSGTTSLTKQGTNYWLLTGSSTFTGTVTLLDGILGMSTINDGGLASPIGQNSAAAANWIINGGTFRYAPTAGTGESTNRLFKLGPAGGTLEANGTASQPITLTDSAALTFTASGTSTLTLGGTSTANNIFARSIVDNGGDAVSLVKSGASTWLLTSTSTFTGGTTISGGILRIGNAGTTGMISGTVTGSGGLSFNRSDDAIFTGTATGTIALTKLLSSTLTLTGDSTSTGIATVSAGKLRLGNAGTTGFWTGNITGVAGTELIFDRSNDLTYPGVISSVIAVTKNGSNTVTFTGTQTYTGTTTIAAGTLQLGNGGTTGTLAVAAPVTGSAGGVIAVNRSDAAAVTMSMVLSGPIGMTKRGSATLVLSGANTHTGITTIEGGALSVLLGNAAASGPFGAVTAAAENIVLDGGTIKHFSSAAATTDRLFTVGPNGGTIEQNSTGSGDTLTFSSTGSLIASGSGNRALTLGGTGTQVFSFNPLIVDPSTGTTSVTKSGPMVLNLLGANTFTGAVRITQGVLVVRELANGNVTNTPLGGSSNAASNLVLNGGTLRYTPIAGTGVSTDRLFTMGTAGATLDASGGTGRPMNFTNTGPIVVEGTGTATLTLTSSVSSSMGTFYPSIVDGPDAVTSLVRTTTGTSTFWTLGGFSTYTGPTIVATATLVLGGNGTSDPAVNRLPATTAISLGTGGAAALQLGTTSATTADPALFGPANQTVTELANFGVNLNRVQGGHTSMSTLTVNIVSGVNDYSGILGYSGANNNNLALVKIGAGTLKLSNSTGTANSFLGGTKITAGTVLLGVVNALPGTVNPTNIVNLSGGKLSTAGGTDGAGFASNAGILLVSANSTLELGTGVHNLQFNGLSLLSTGALTITGWTGAPVSSGTSGKLIFVSLGSASSANTTYASFLSTVHFEGFAQGGTFLTSGANVELVPVVPEPRTVMFLGALALGLVQLRRSRRHSISPTTAA